MKTRLGIVIASILVILPLLGLGAGQAFALAHNESAVVPHASTLVHNESDLAGNQYALNNWSDEGYIRMGYQGAPNSDIGWHSVNRCTDANGDPTDLVQSTVTGGGTENCPFANQNLDAEYAGYIISSLTIPSGGTSNCLGINSANDLIVSTCPNFTTGAGGGNGTIFINYNTGAGCSNDNEEEFVSRPESDAVDATKFLHDPNVYAGYPSFGSYTCWVSADHVLTGPAK
jgi:hypothetical protein